MANGEDKPLWMPTGSVRAIIALMAITTLVIGALKVIEIPQPMWDLGLLIAGFYFGTKATELLNNK